MSTKETSTKLPRMSAVGKRRLRKLIAFLRTLKPKDFYFGDVIKDYKTNGHTCGTVCCAIGWTPAVFPKLTKWFMVKAWGDAYPALCLAGDSKRKEKEYWEIAAELFGVSEATAENLFMPSGACYVHEDLPELNAEATPKQVARMLEKYIKLTETQQPA